MEVLDIMTMPDQGKNTNRISKTTAILFDLHHTITKTGMDMHALTREAAMQIGIDLSGISKEQLAKAIDKSDKWIKEYQLENNVDIHWGGKPEQWIDANRIVFEDLGFENIEDKTLLDLEIAWKEIMQNRWESLIEDAKKTLDELDKRGYKLGICTRRHDDPRPLLKRWGILHLFLTVSWTGVVGYAKPSPYTLLKGSDELGVNPRRCAYVGNYVDADVGASMRAEMLPVLVTWANPKEKEKAPEDIIVIENIIELLEIFTGPAN